MAIIRRWETFFALPLVLVLTGCGGGDAKVVGLQPALLTEPGAPALSGNVAVDGLNWINFRRKRLGVPELTRCVFVDAAAQGHANYQRVNGEVTHEQTSTKASLTGVNLAVRMSAGGYVLATYLFRAASEASSC